MFSQHACYIYTCLYRAVQLIVSISVHRNVKSNFWCEIVAVVGVVSRFDDSLDARRSNILSLLLATQRL